jgi:hypothetical protein
VLKRPPVARPVGATGSALAGERGTLVPDVFFAVLAVCESRLKYVVRLPEAVGADTWTASATLGFAVTSFAELSHAARAD